MNNAQALVHGDLHTGSIFINQTGLKVIDPEFAFYGPMGYDIGNVLAHLVFPLVLDQTRKAYNEDFQMWLLTNIKEIYDKVWVKFKTFYEENVHFKLYRNEQFKQRYLKSIMADALGYTGTEIIRRVVGDSKVKELSLITEDKKVHAERLLVNYGKHLIKNRENISSGNELVDIFKQCKEGI